MLEIKVDQRLDLLVNSIFLAAMLLFMRKHAFLFDMKNSITFRQGARCYFGVCLRNYGSFDLVSVEMGFSTLNLQQVTYT